jgi:hypothetical protein
VSDPSAIAAVTATLRNLLTRGLRLDPNLNDATVTVLPIDRARDANNNANQLNLFLYQVTPNGAWRNMDMPRTVHQGETAVPPLALNLYYLLTTFGKDNDAAQPFSHQLMGRAMSILYDHPLLGADEIRAALPGNDLFAQIERVRFTWQPLAVEDIFKLWSGFQTQYRLSVSYEAAVVLIDSSRRARTPLPVLKRGPKDAGVVAQADTLSPFPTIESVMPPGSQSTAIPGGVLTISGSRFDGGGVQIVLRNPLLPNIAPLQPNAADVTASTIKVTLPAAAQLLAGMYTLAVEVTINAGTPDERVQASNEYPVAIAPAIVSGLPLQVRINNGSATIQVTCAPQILATQRASLLLGDREILANPRDAATTQLTFAVQQAVAGTYALRLRVDGVDSQLIDRSQKPPAFFPNQEAVLA